MNEKLRDARLACGWTQEQASQKADIDYRQYRRYELGESRPSLSSLQKLCNAFEMTPVQLGFAEAEL